MASRAIKVTRATRAKQARRDKLARLDLKASPARGKDGRDGVSPPLPFRIVRAAVDNGISKPALCGTDEIMISATCIVKAGEAAQSPRTMGESGASCDTKPGQSDPPQAVILCTKPQQ